MSNLDAPLMDAAYPSKQSFQVSLVSPWYKLQVGKCKYSSCNDSKKNKHAVDGSEFRRLRADLVVLSHYLQGEPCIQTVVFSPDFWTINSTINPTSDL